LVNTVFYLSISTKPGGTSWFVGDDAQENNFGTVGCFTNFVEHVFNPACNAKRHAQINFLSEFNKPKWLPKVHVHSMGQTVELDCNAISPHPWARSEYLKAEWLGFSTANGISKVDIRFGTKARHRVHQRNIYAPLGVFQQHRHLRFTDSYYDQNFINKKFAELTGTRSAFGVI